MSIARPHGRARIETSAHPQATVFNIASPGLTAGRGLKLLLCVLFLAHTCASPGLTAGRGLKPLEDGSCTQDAGGIARPHGRARIETATGPSWPTARPSIARPHGRARIETRVDGPSGRGVRRIARPHGRARIETPSRPWCSTHSPCIARPHGRARIETLTAVTGREPGDKASPGLTAGRGLKHRRP